MKFGFPTSTLIIKASLCISILMFTTQTSNAQKPRPSYEKIVEIKGKKQFFLAKGKGTPEVVFITGLGVASDGFAELQRKLSKKTSTFSYDRAGLGKSQAFGTDRTIQNLSEELKDLLEATGHKDPVVLVAHSRGALVARYFISMYPDKVAGLILIDPATPEIRAARMALRNEAEQHELDSLFRAFFSEDAQYSPTIKSEFKCSFYSDSTEMADKLFPANIPITAFISTKTNEEKYSEKDVSIKAASIVNTLKSAPQCKIVYTKKAGHFIFLEEPKMVRKEIIAMVKSLRKPVAKKK